MIIQAFVRDYDGLMDKLEECEKEHRSKVLILTEPLCDLETRERIFRDIVATYEEEGQVFIKPHPRDLLDYRTLFGEYPQFDATMPMELLNFFPTLRFSKVVGVFTEMKGLSVADECVRLGPDFMDQYEDPAIHRQNEQI